MTQCKIQVLTANLGHILDVKGTEQGLTDFKGTSTLTFDQFRYYVQTEVFSALPDQVIRICESLKRDSCCPSDMICVLSKRITSNSALADAKQMTGI